MEYKKIKFIAYSDDTFKEGDKVPGKEFEAHVNIIKAEDTSEQKRNSAAPGKPAILLE